MFVCFRLMSNKHADQNQLNIYVRVSHAVVKVRVSYWDPLDGDNCANPYWPETYSLPSKEKGKKRSNNFVLFLKRGEFYMKRSMKCMAISAYSNSSKFTIN